MAGFDREAYKTAVDYITDSFGKMNDGMEFVLKKLQGEDSFADLYAGMKNSDYRVQPGQLITVSNVMSAFLLGITEDAEAKAKMISELCGIEDAVYKDDKEKLPDKYAEGYYDYGVDMGSLARYMDNIEEEYQDTKNVLESIEEVQKEFRNMDDAGSYLQVFLRSDLYLLKNFGIAANAISPLRDDLTANLTQLEQVRERVLDKLCERADKELEKVAAWLKEHEGAFQMMDLKLHDASYYEYKEMEDDFPVVAKAMEEGLYGRDYTPFYLFCEREYDSFTDWCAEEGIDFDKIRHQVGRTSSFYLHDEGNLVCLSRRDYTIDLKDTMECLVGEFGYQYADVCFGEDGHLDMEYVKSHADDVIQNIEYIASGALFSEVENRFSDMLNVYQYIKDVKENQVSLFKEWLEYEKERILEDYPEFEECTSQEEVEKEEV